jgi:DNA mismatch repair ATPase MutS
MLRLLADAPFASSRLTRIRARLQAGGGAPRQLARLERIAAWAEVRYSPMLHGALQWLFLWDIQVAASLERWRRAAGAHVRDWLAQLGEAEALAALATLAHDNPTWTFPEIVQGGAPLVEGSAVGHPLIPATARVTNEVSVGPPGSFLLVTGSNMSGKSTLLRAIGANVVLAQAGAPVCAARFRLPLLAVYTSVRVQDSLEEGISLFMAELRRLKLIVDAARAAPQDRPVLYLLDEILHGTNSAERRVAARTVIGHLIDAGAIGVVTTHDLALASEGELALAARPVQFTEHVDRSASGMAMRFDYRLRPGLATSANALALLELVGLGDRSSR